MLRRYRTLPVLCCLLACRPADPGASTGTTEAAPGPATLGASTTGTPTTGSSTTDMSTTGDTSATGDTGTTVAAPTTGAGTDATTTDATTTTDPISGTSTTDIDATTGGSSTGAPLDVCDERPFPDMPQHPCDEFTTLETCADGGCVWVHAASRFTVEDCACLEHPPTDLCVFTEGQYWGGSQTPSAMFRVIDGAVEVMVLGVVPFDDPPGWIGCGSVESPAAACDCACPDVLHCIF